MKSYYKPGGKTTHYDDNGNVTGASYENRSGSTVRHYDAHGKHTGLSSKSPSGHITHYDAKGQKTGYSRVTKSGQFIHYDTNHRETARSTQNFMEQHVTTKHPQPVNPGCLTVTMMLLTCLTLLWNLF